MSEEIIKPLVNCQEKRQLETLQKLVEEDRERRLAEEARIQRKAVQERKTWRKRV